MLKKGCALYRYSYRIEVDEAEYNWLLQVQITDAGGTNQAFQFFTSGEPGDPTSGTSTFQLCSANVHAPGMFTLSGELDLDNGVKQTVVHYTPVKFKIAPAPAKKKAVKHKKKKRRRRRRRRRSTEVGRPQTTWCNQRTGAPSPAWRKVSSSSSHCLPSRRSISSSSVVSPSADFTTAP